MLVLSRKVGETIVINENVRVTVLSVRANHVRLGISAPNDVAVFREELLLDVAPQSKAELRLHPAATVAP